MPLQLVYSKNGTAIGKRSKKSLPSSAASSAEIVAITRDLHALENIKPAYVGGIAIIVRNLLRDARARTAGWRVGDM